MQIHLIQHSAIAGVRLRLCRAVVLALAPVLFCLCGRANASEIHDAVQHGDLPAVKALVEKIPDILNTPNAAEFQSTPLLYAIAGQNVEMVKYILSVPGIKVDQADGREHHPLQEAVACGNLEIVTILLDHHAPVDYPKPQIAYDPITNRSLLVMAIQAGNTDCLKILLTHANGYQPGDPGLAAALPVSLCAPDPTYTLLLLERDPNLAKTQIYIEPFSNLIKAAAAGGNATLLQAVIDKGGDPNPAPAKDQATPFDIAIDRRKGETTDLLWPLVKKRLLDECRAAPKPAEAQDLLFQKMLSAGSVTGCQELRKMGWPFPKQVADVAVWFAVLKSNRAAALEWLLQSGYKPVDGRPLSRNNLLFTAVEERCWEAATWLLDHGAVATAVNAKGKHLVDLYVVFRLEPRWMGGRPAQDAVDFWLSAVKKGALTTLDQAGRMKMIVDLVRIRPEDDTASNGQRVDALITLVLQLPGTLPLKPMKPRPNSSTAIDDESENPLATALAAQNTAVVKILLENKCDVNLPFPSGSTPVDFFLKICGTTAVAGRRKVILEALLAAGANGNSAQRPSVALSTAILNDQPWWVVKALVENGADMNTQYPGGFSPFGQFCEKMGYHADPQISADEWTTRLEFMLQHGGDLNVKERGGAQTMREFLKFRYGDKVRALMAKYSKP